MSSEINWAEVGATAEDSTGVIPDHTKSRDSKPAKEKFQEFVDKTNLGNNKATRSTVRKLNEADRKKIEGFYAGVALVFVAPTPLYNPDGAQALATQASECANAWMNLAENNDAVRRMVLVFIEGGAWGAVAAAHAPIFMAFLPEHTKRTLAAMFMRSEVPDSPEGL